MTVQRVASQIPDPEHFWIAFAPRQWPAAPRHEPWLDLARGRKGEPGRGESVTGLHGEPFDDVVYLPPVEVAFAPARDELAARLAAKGTPVLVQLYPGEVASASELTVVWDLTAALLARDLASLSVLPPGSAVLFPLLPGVTDDPGFVTAACRHLAAAGVAVAQAVVPSLTPSERRRLADEHGEAAFDRLFHGPPPDPRGFACIAREHGLAPFLPRPLPRLPLLGAGNREAAGLVALAAELAERLERPPMVVQALFRSARFLDRTHHDVRALAREGHLALLDPLDGASREIVKQWAATGSSSRVDADLAEYLAAKGISSRP